MLQKSDGTFELLLWNEVSVFNTSTFADITNADVPVQILTSGPDSRWAAIRQLYANMIISAEHHVYLQSPYFILDASIAEALRSASQYGQWRARGGASAANIAKDFRVVEEADYQLIQKNLTVTDLLPLISDLRRLGIGLNLLMEQSLQSFVGSGKKTAPA